MNILKLFSLLGLTLLASLLSLPASATNPIEPLNFASETQRERYHSLIEEIRCTVCQNEALASSDAPLAADLRGVVYRHIIDGRADSEIRNFMRERYGDFVLYTPPLAAHTLLLWAGPPALLVFGGLACIVMIRRRRKMLLQPQT